jgi:hypothetical protein
MAANIRPFLRVMPSGKEMGGRSHAACAQLIASSKELTFSGAIGIMERGAERLASKANWYWG